MPHILLIEDNPGDAILVREMYRDADTIDNMYTITHVERVKNAVKLLAERDDFDLILSDMSLPDSQGLETLAALRKTAAELPVIFMTGTNSEAFVSEAIKAGAQDYLVKGTIDSQVLARATQYSIERKKAQIQYESAVQQTKILEENAELLKQQKQELLALNVAKDEFISLASHQLRTPATAVKQYLGLILEGYVGAVPDYLMTYLNTAYNSNERQLKIINDLLRTAQLDSGHHKLVKESHDVCQLVADVIADCMPVIRMRGQKLEYHHTTPCLVDIDASELKVAVSNLVENASKYSPSGSTIQVAIRSKGNCLTVSVEDEGVGIAKADIAKVFDKFTRLDNELSDTVSGNGLGLYFVKRIAKLHGGKVTVKSELHRGSTFTLSLPLRPETDKYS